MKKTARKTKPAAVTPGAKKKPVAGRIATKARQSAPAEDSHGEAIASCEEFTIYADGWLESSPAVELAMKRARFANNSRHGADDRLKLKLALWDLMEDAAGQFTGDPKDLLDALSETLGQTLLDALNKAEGAGKRIRGAIKKVSACMADVEGAITQMVRYRSALPMPGDKSPGAWTWMLQYTAKAIFRETRERPTKSEIRRRLEAEGWTFRGNDPAENWRRVFAGAGLKNLPS